MTTKEERKDEYERENSLTTGRQYEIKRREPTVDT
jgi:hypothetical protein